MDNEKDIEFDEGTSSQKDSEFPAESALRARNRTVMLTPEITTQVRQRLAQESGHVPHHSPAPAQAPRPSSGGFEPASSFIAGRSAPPPAFDAPTALGTQPMASHAPAREGIVWVKESPIVGFLVSYDGDPNGDAYPLRSGRLIISSQQGAAENTLLISDPSVSPMHAILRISAGGEIQVLDQLSEQGTKIRHFESGEEELLSGEKGTVEHGDTLTFGERTFHVCIVPRSEQA